MRRRQDVVPVVLCSLLVAGTAGTVIAQTRAAAVTPQAPAAASVTRPWTVTGGDVAIRWNYDLARDLGIDIAPAGVLGTRASDGAERFAASGDALEFNVENGYLRSFGKGLIRARGGYGLTLPDGSIDLHDFRLVPRASSKSLPGLDLVDAQGTGWFTIDRVMHEVFDGDAAALTVSSSDIRIGERLARRLGQPEVAGWTIGEVQFDLPVTRRGSGGVDPQGGSAVYHWHGDPAPGGGTYQNDLMMESTFAQYLRCQGCTGNAGSGRVVITPSSTLKNNVNNGSVQATVPGDPLGTSSALWTAGVPWYQKFSGRFPPYDNDQHPYLIWNMYRLNPDGSIEQIGRSGIKQAYLTVNVGCLQNDPSDHNPHVLGRGCADTYSVSNNDFTQGLSPRSELLPATGIWGRCGSTFDPDCNGQMNTYPGDEYWQRMVVGESQISPTANAGASWLFESWYLAREDINIYNSMSTLATTQSWTGNVWNVGSSQERLGSAIDRWYAIGAPTNRRLGLSKRHIEEVVIDGARAKVAVKADRLGDGRWRYHYAVMNFEFAFGTQSGTNPDIRVTGNQGFDGFAIHTASAAQATATFRDGDLDDGNDWQFGATASAARWRDAAGAPNSLWWGGLYSFTLVSPKAPILGEATLYADNAPTPRAYAERTLVPRP